MGVSAPNWSRYVAIARIIRDTGIAEQVLTKLCVDDINVDEPSLRIPGASAAEVSSRPPLLLRPSTANALSAWLRHRDETVSGLEGGEVSALWVRVRAGGSDKHIAVPGLPITVRGLRKSWASTTEILLDELGAPELSMRTLRIGCRDHNMHLVAESAPTPTKV
jgi:hypothetical protein